MVNQHQGGNAADGIPAGQSLLRLGHRAAALLDDIRDQQHVGAVGIDFKPVGYVLAQDPRREGPDLGGLEAGPELIALIVLAVSTVIVVQPVVMVVIARRRAPAPGAR